MDNKQYNALFSFIWNIANDVLVHAFEKWDYKKIILPFMVLRRIDVLEAIVALLENDFYKPVQLCTLKAIMEDIRAIERDTEGLLDEIMK